MNRTGGSNPNRFTYVDGTGDQSFYQVAGEFPWGFDQPNDLEGNQDCVE